MDGKGYFLKLLCPSNHQKGNWSLMQKEPEEPNFDDILSDISYRRTWVFFTMQFHTKCTVLKNLSSSDEKTVQFNSLLLSGPRV